MYMNRAFLFHANEQETGCSSGRFAAC